MKRRPITLFVPDLNGGGAERTVVNLLRHSHLWAEPLGLEPILVLRRWDGAYLDLVPPAIPRHVLGTPRSGWPASVRTAVGLGGMLKRTGSAALIAFLSGPATLAARVRAPGCKLLVSVQTSPVAWAATKGALSRPILRGLQGVVFRQADHVLPISEGVKDELLTCYGVPERRVTHLPNPVDVRFVKSMASARTDAADRIAKGRGLRLVTAGRLVHQKKQEDLLHALARLRGMGREAELFILGEGPRLNELSALARELRVGRWTHFLGFQTNPFSAIRQGDVFVLSSQYEGFANVLVEALACGVPVVSTDAPHGPREILADGRYGLLTPVGDAASLADAIDSLRCPTFRQSLCDAARDRANQYDVRVVTGRLRQVLECVLALQGASTCASSL